MHRFNNGKSDINSLKIAFKTLHKNIPKNSIFDLDDIAEILVKTGNVSSSGLVGEEALARGYNKDRSLDGPYNQSKMLAETFRYFGWIQSTKEKALEFSFTLLGDTIVMSNFNQSLIVKCLINMEFPNDNIAIKGKNKIKPFLGILKIMNALNGILSRDELIYYLFIEDDSSKKSINKTVKKLSELRKQKGKLNNLLDVLCKNRIVDGNKRPITRTTAENNTRLPLALLKNLGLTNRIKDNQNYLSPTVAFEITDKAKRILKVYEKKLDIRLDDIKSKKILKEASISSYYSMLAESGIDISQYSSIKEQNDGLLFKKIGHNNIAFSPFQVLDVDNIEKIFKTSTKLKKIPRNALAANKSKDIQKSYFHLNVSLEKTNKDSFQNELSDKIKKLLNHQSEERTVIQLKSIFRNYDKNNFYPLIRNIFDCMGINCYLPPHGDNSQRFDAMLLSSNDTVPIEIKSPREEVKIGVKAVRQALENKVILRARFRKTWPSKSKTSSLVIGWEVPNLRSQDFELINDIYKAYGIKIAVIGIDSLLRACVKAIGKGHISKFEDFSNMEVGIYK